MNFETLAVEIDGPVGRVVLNRPERLNAMNPTMLRELAEAAGWFDSQPDARVVIVSGAGRAFSAGADLKEASTQQAKSSWRAYREAARAGSRMIDAIDAMKAITIASVHGYAIGGAVLLMAACDLRIAAEDAVFS